MTWRLVLDAEPLWALAGRRSRRQVEVRGAMRAALEREHDVVIPTVVLAELYRGRGRTQTIDACLARDPGVLTRDTDRGLARIVGDVLSSARAGSEDIVDAHVVAVAIEGGGGLVLTGDPSDLRKLAAAHPTVRVQPLT